MLRGLVLTVICATALAAQSSGGGIAGSGSGRVVRHWLYSNLGRDSVQLRGVVVLRGAEAGWREGRDSISAAAERRVLDSLADASVKAGRLGGLGYATGRTRVWIELDHRHRAIRFGEMVLPWLPEDSIHVITVDRVDHVGGEPRLSRYVLPAPPQPRVRADDLLPTLRRWTAYLREHGAQDELLGWP